MSRALFCLGCCLALTGGAIAQTANDANHGFRFSKDGPNANTYTCSWWGLLGEYYFLQHSEDLITWSYFPNTWPGGGKVITPLGFPVSGNDRFFLRLKYLTSYTSPPLETDYDADKVLTADELEEGTDPFGAFADSDGDNMPDDWEAHFGLDPHDPTDATTGPAEKTDPDGDGISNLAEFQTGPLGTIPPITITA